MENKNVQIIVVGVIAAILLPIAITNLYAYNYAYFTVSETISPYPVSLAMNATSPTQNINTSVLFPSSSATSRNGTMSLSFSNASILNASLMNTRLYVNSSLISNTNFNWTRVFIFALNGTSSYVEVDVIVTNAVNQTVTLYLSFTQTELFTIANGETINTFMRVLYPILLMVGVLMGIVGYVDYKRKN